MSTSEQPNGVVSGPLTRLVAAANNPLVEVVVVNDRFQRAASGFGRVETDVPAGVYRIDFVSGSMMQEHWVVVEKDRATPMLTVSAKPFAPLSPAPITTGADERELQLAALAREWSVQPRLHLGSGSRLFVLADLREAVSGVLGFAGATVHDAHGRLVVALEACARVNYLHRVAGACVDLSPGTYRFRVPTHSGTFLEQSVHLANGWATQVFLRTPDVVALGSDMSKSPASQQRHTRRPTLDTARAAISMARLETPYDANDPSTLLLESARVALVSGQRGTMSPAIAEQLVERATNPMVALLACYFEVRARDPKLSLVSTMLTKVETEAPDHPDALALRLWLADRGDAESASRVRGRAAIHPPMVGFGWRFLTDGSADRPDLVSPDSSIALVADRIVSAVSTWFLWEAPIDPELLGGSSGPARSATNAAANTFHESSQRQEFDSLRPRSFLQLVRYVQDHALTARSAREHALDHQFTPLEAAVLEYVARSAGPSTTIDETLREWPSLRGEHSVMRASLPRPPLGALLTPRAAVQALGAPTGAIMRAIAGACTKLKLTTSEFVPLPKLRDQPSFTGDTQKGRFGGRAQRDYFRLEATVLEMPNNLDWFRVRATVRSMDPRRRPLSGDVHFFLHETFGKEPIVRPTLRGKAEWEGFAWGSFTLGARVLSDGSDVLLELDLATLPDAPDVFKAR